jgi:hypothetical protein
MSYVPMVKLSAQFVAGLGVSKILTDVVKNNVSVLTTADAVKVWAGSLVLGSMMVEQSSNHIERITSEVVAWHKSRNPDTNP